MKWLLFVLAIPVAGGMLVAFLKIRFGLIKDEADRRAVAERYIGWHPDGRD
jgi:hypothetical protein